MKYESDSDFSSSWNRGSDAQNLRSELEDLEIRGRIKTIQTTALIRSASILKRVLVK